MVNQQVLQGSWNDIKGKLRTRWGQLTDDDLSQFHGEVDKLVGIIQRKTGEGREAIENYLSDVSSSASSTIGQTVEGVRQYTNRVAENAQNTARQAADQFRAGYGEAERIVRDRPTQSLAVCFGMGLITGAVLAVMFSSGRQGSQRSW